MLTFILDIFFLIAISFIIIPLMQMVKIQRRIRSPANRIHRLHRWEKWLQRIIQKEEHRDSNQKLRKLLKVSGHPFGLNVFRFIMVRNVSPVAGVLLFFLFYFLSMIKLGYQPRFHGIYFCIVIIAMYFLPDYGLQYLAFKRKILLSKEIAKFTHRLMVNISDDYSIYYAIKRAGRTLHYLKPYVDEMLQDWLEDSQTAIRKFRDAVGIPEIYPITNTLEATSRAPETNIVELFNQQIRNIDRKRDLDVNKEIEAAPVKAMFIVMIPFLVVIVLILLPWYHQLIDRLHQL